MILIWCLIFFLLLSITFIKRKTSFARKKKYERKSSFTVAELQIFDFSNNIWYNVTILVTEYNICLVTATNIKSQLSIAFSVACKSVVSMITIFNDINIIFLTTIFSNISIWLRLGCVCVPWMYKLTFVHLFFFHCRYSSVDWMR